MSDIWSFFVKYAWEIKEPFSQCIKQKIARSSTNQYDTWKKQSLLTKAQFFQNKHSRIRDLKRLAPNKYSISVESTFDQPFCVTDQILVFVGSLLMFQYFLPDDSVHLWINCIDVSFHEICFFITNMTRRINGITSFWGGCGGRMGWGGDPTINQPSDAIN